MIGSILFPSHDLFLAARGADPPDQHDYGIWWRDRHGGVFRLTWLGPRRRDTDAAPAGELYLLALRGSHFGSVELLCLIPPAVEAASERYPDLDGNVEAILEGWPDVCGAEGSIDWVYDRVREALEAGWAQPVDAAITEGRPT